MIRLADEAATRALGAALAPLVRAGDAIALSGDLGAGKTTLARGLIEALGHEGEVASPTFALLQLYDDLSPPVVHADLYRLAAPEDVTELGLDDYAATYLLLVEWPERAGGRLGPGALRLRLAIQDEARALTAEVPGAWEGRWPPPAR